MRVISRGTDPPMSLYERIFLYLGWIGLIFGALTGDLVVLFFGAVLFVPPQTADLLRRSPPR
jgi:hypothetical protein